MRPMPVFHVACCVICVSDARVYWFTSTITKTCAVRISGACCSRGRVMPCGAPTEFPTAMKTYVFSLLSTIPVPYVWAQRLGPHADRREAPHESFVFSCVMSSHLGLYLGRHSICRCITIPQVC
ncbi:unnamed protein product [Pylaiella littoralis]